MNFREPSFTVGIEEEYLLVDVESRDLAGAPDALMSACANELQGQVSPEFLQCQIEVGTRVCDTVAAARSDLANLRSTIARLAGEHGMAPMAASAHPFADWHVQSFTDKERYHSLARDLAGVARRMLICGMHVHVGIEDDELRIDLLSQVPYFLPHLLALSTSSPFWQGHETGLKSYRLTVFDNLPRTGLPPEFASFAEFQRTVQIIINTGLIEDSTKIWWDVRPSDKFPTLEVRICDVSPRLDDAISIAAITQSLLRMLYRLRRDNKRWRKYDNFLVRENRWRAQRYGTSEGLIDFGLGEVVAYEDLLEEIIELLEPDAEALSCLDELYATRAIPKSGTSADRQLAVYRQAIEAGADETEALKAVVDSLVAETVAGLD